MNNNLYEKKRISAVIIQDGKMLFVTGFNEQWYWTPGGKNKHEEAPEETLIRELKEELGLEVKNSKYYLSYITPKFNEEFKDIGEKIQVDCYLVEVNGSPIPNQEITNFFWWSKSEIMENESKLLGNEIKEQLIPKLIQDNLI
jgi:8-oxo-dGTP diphosphatase